MVFFDNICQYFSMYLLTVRYCVVAMIRYVMTVYNRKYKKWWTILFDTSLAFGRTCWSNFSLFVESSESTNHKSQIDNRQSTINVCLANKSGDMQLDYNSLAVLAGPAFSLCLLALLAALAGCACWPCLLAVLACCACMLCWPAVFAVIVMRACCAGSLCLHAVPCCVPL